MLGLWQAPHHVLGSWPWCGAHVKCPDHAERCLDSLRGAHTGKENKWWPKDTLVRQSELLWRSIFIFCMYRVMACMDMGKRFISPSRLTKRTSKEVYHFHESIRMCLFVRLVFWRVPLSPVLEFSYSNMCAHKALKVLRDKVDLEHQCGYITMLNSNNRNRLRPSDADTAGESQRWSLNRLFCPYLDRLIRKRPLRQSLARTISKRTNYIRIRKNILIGQLFISNSVGLLIALYAWVNLASICIRCNLLRASCVLCVRRRRIWYRVWCQWKQRVFWAGYRREQWGRQ